METFETMTEAIAALHTAGYTEDLSIEHDHILSHDQQYRMSHHEFVIDRFYRFEGMTDPADAAIVYAISSAIYKIKGILVTGYGMYDESMSHELSDKLNFRPKT